jgi:hypothetical protein
MLALLDGAGQTIGSPSVAGEAAVIDCVAFQPGTGDLTLTFLKYDGTTNMPILEIAEINEASGVGSTLSLTLSSDTPTCPLITPTDKGYSLAWQDKVGTWLGVYDSTTNRFFIYPAAGAVVFGGSDLQPPLAGFGPAGADYMLVFAKVGSTELWRLDNRGNRRPGVLAFPSSQGDLGTVFSLPVAGSLFTTYADYTATDAGVGAAGQRYFLQASCL